MTSKNPIYLPFWTILVTLFFLTNQLQESPESLTGKRTDPHLSSELRFKLLSETLYWNEHPTGKENHC